MLSFLLFTLQWKMRGTDMKEETGEERVRLERPVAMSLPDRRK